MKSVVVGLILMSIASSAVADENGAFADLLMGSAEQTATAEGLVEASGDDLSFGVRGGFAFNPNIALEVGYHDYGDAEQEYFDDTSDQFNVVALSAGIKSSIVFDNGFSLSARVGVSLWDLDLYFSEYGSIVYAASDDGSDFYVGIGGQMKITERVHIGAEYTLTELDVSFGEFSFDHEIKNLSLSLGYKF